MKQAELVEIALQGSGERANDVVSPILAKLDVLDPHFEHVARLGAFDRNRAGEDVAGKRLLGIGVNVRHLGRRAESGFGPGVNVRSAGDRIDGDRIAAPDRELRLQGGIEEAPMARRAARLEMMVGHAGPRREPIPVIGSMPSPRRGAEACSRLAGSPKLAAHFVTKRAS